MKKTILVPTDFSRVANHALEYAILLAKKLKAEIVIVHAYNIVYLSPEVPMSVISEQLISAESYAADKLKVLCKKVKNHRVPCHAINETDEAIGLIRKTIAATKPMFVVMGTTGADGVIKTFLGTNTASLIGKVKCPIIAIPKQTFHFPAKQITYATNYQAADLRSLKKIIDFFGSSKPAITIVHVPEGNLSPKTEEKKLARFQAKVLNSITYNKFTFQIVHGQSPVKAMEKYIKKSSPELFVMTALQHNLFERLFKTSTSKKLAYHTSIPLLILH